VAKPRYRWRAPTKIVTRKRDPLGAPVGGRRSGSSKPPPLTRERGKRSSVPRAELGPRTEPSEGCDRERQRSFASFARGRQRRGEVALLSRAVASGSGSPEMGSSNRVVEWTEAGDRAVKRAPPGAGSPKGGLAPQSPTSSGSGGGGGRRGASHALGNHAIHGCSCRESVAEVGEEHLSRTLEGSREANREGAR
jgi:hypothetical protein